MATGDPSRPTPIAIVDSVMIDEQSHNSYTVNCWNPVLLEPVSPQAIIISTGLQEAMTENKKALERKLQHRRPITQLVEQGIMPPPRTPPAHFKQFKDLERAKTSDILNIKMKNRPERNLLVAQNILPDPKVSPVIVDHQKQLRKAMISNSLNDKLASRPGPLELVEHNILEPSPELKDALKDGKIKYVRTCEGEDPRKRTAYFNFDELSSSSPESLLSPSDESETTTPPVVLPASVLLLASSNAPSEQHPGGGKIRIKKGKSKGPDGSRPKTIKFHEYKGPHLSGKKKKQMSDAELAASESPYNIMLQQQQLFLQWQLQKHGVNKAGSAGADPNSNGGVSAKMPNDVLLPSILNELTVQTLKQELKRRNLNVSGTKTQLVERLRNYLFGGGISSTSPLGDAKRDSMPTSPVAAGSTSAPAAVLVSLTQPVQTAPSAVAMSPEQMIIQMYQQRVQELESELSRHRMGTGPMDTNGAQNVQLAANGTSRTLTAHMPSSPNAGFSEKELKELLRPLQEQLNSNSNSWPIISNTSSGNGHFNGNVLMSSMPEAAKNRLQPVPRDRCQSVEDVLDILIDSGELSPSVKLVSPNTRSRGARDSLLVEPDNDPMDWLDSALRTPEPWFDTEMRSPAPTLDDGLDPLAIKTPTEAQLAHWDQLTEALLSPNALL